MDFFKKHEISRHNRPFNERDFNSRVPRYNDDSDYTTNAPSYYDDLARKNKLLKTLSLRIWEYQEVINKQFNEWDDELRQRFLEWDKNLEEFDDEVLRLLEEWMTDGTFEQIINHNIFNDLNTKIDAIENRLGHVVLSVKDFGAKGDGVQDDTSYIQDAVNALGGTGGDVYFPPGHYKVTDSILVNNDNIRISGIRGSSIIDIGDRQDIEGVFLARGKILNEKPINADLEKGLTELPVYSDTPYIIIKTDEAYNELRTNYRKGEFLSIEGYTLADVLEDSYTHTGNNLKMLEIEPIRNITVENLTIIKDFSDTTGVSSGVRFEIALNCTVNNIDCKNFDYAHVSFDRSYNCKTLKSHFENDGLIMGLGYGLSVSNSSRKFYASGLTGKKLRHLTALGSAYNNGMVRYALFENLYDEHSYITSFDIHEIAEHIKYLNCVGENHNTGGRYNTFENCVFLPATNSLNYIDGNIFEVRFFSDYTKYIGCTFKRVVGFRNHNVRGQFTIKGLEFKGCTFEFEDDLNKVDTLYNEASFSNIKDVLFKDNKFISYTVKETDVNDVVKNKPIINMNFGEGTIFDSNQFINLRSPLTVTQSDITIKDNVFKNCFDHIISVTTNYNFRDDITKNIIISKNKFISEDHDKVTASRYSIYVMSNIKGRLLNGLSINDNFMELHENISGIRLESETQDPEHRNSIINISGNIIYNAEFYGIFVGHDWETGLISNNITLGNLGGIVKNAQSDLILSNNV